MDWGKKRLVDFNFGESHLHSFDQSSNNGAVEVEMDGSVLEQKSFLRC